MEEKPQKKSLLSIREKQPPGRLYMSKKLKLLNKLMSQGKIPLTLTFSDLKRYEGRSLFPGFHNRVKYDFAKFVSNCLNSEVSSCHLDNRASFAFLVLSLISGFSVLEKGKTDEHQLKILLRHMGKEKSIFTCAARLPGFVFVKPLTVVQAVDLKNLLHLPMAAFCCMHTTFLNLGYVRLFPSELKMRQLLNTPVSHLHEAEMSVESMILQASGSDKKVIYAPVLRMKNLLGYVNAVFNKFNEKSLYTFL